jgi:hypothetical protein
MSFGSFLKNAFTPPKSKNNIIRAATAPITGGLSLLAPNAVVNGARTAVRYTGLITQTIVAPVLPARTQAKIFGLSPSESKLGEIGQKVSRGIFAVAAARTS